MNNFIIINKIEYATRIKNMFNCNNARDEISRILKLNKKMKKKLNFLMDRSIKVYIKRDLAEDIEHTIFEGILSFLNFQKVVISNYDYFTERVLINKRAVQIEKSPLLKVIIMEFNRIRIASNPNQLKFLIENIISLKYGLMSRKRRDILKVYIDLQEEYIEDSINSFGIYDPDSEVDVEMKCFVNKYFESLNEDEKLIFNKYFYEDIGYSEMIVNNFVKNEYVLKNFIKKTKNYFYEQLVG